MWVELPHDLANGPCGFRIGSSSDMAGLMHAIEHATVNGFEPIPYIGERPSDDDAHGVVDVRSPHFIRQLSGHERPCWLRCRFILCVHSLTPSFRHPRSWPTSHAFR